MNKKILSLATLVVGSGIFFSSAQATFAYRGDPTIQGPYYSEERHEEMEQTFENKDYNAWYTLMQGKGRVTQVINEGNFARFAEMHQLMEEGRYEEANAIRAELGLGLQDGSNKYQNRGYGRNANR